VLVIPVAKSFGDREIFSWASMLHAHIVAVKSNGKTNRIDSMIFVFLKRREFSDYLRHLRTNAKEYL
jgi:hypothetical protein